MHETQIFPCSIHHSDHDDLIVFYHKMNDVGESFDQAGAETIGGYRDQPWVFQDTINCCHIFSQELISQGERPLNRILTSPEVIWLSCGS